MQLTRMYAGASLVALMALCASHASAQSTPAPVTTEATAETAGEAMGPVGVEEIVVTAQKRSERAQDVPISLTALSEEALAEAQVDNVLDLQRVAPSFAASRATQAANTRLSIRGIGSSGNSSIEPSVGAFVDGIYIPRPGPLLATLNDIASVEVLRGPQGTLFGRNTSMGAISFYTNNPAHEFGGEVSAQVGSFEHLRLTGVINVPLNEQVAVRASVLRDENGGWGRNGITGDRFGFSDMTSVRGAVRVEFTPSLTWLLKGDYQKQKSDGFTPATVVADTVTPAARANLISRLGGQIPILDDTYTHHALMNTNGALRETQYGVASDLSLDVGGFTVRLLSGYRDWDYAQSEEDVVQVPVTIYGREGSFRSRSHSQELQLISPEDTLLGGRLDFVAGLYYYNEIFEIGEEVNLGVKFCDLIAAARRATCLAGPLMDATRFDFKQVTDSYAAFGQATFAITDTLDFTGGVRYSHDSKDGDLVSILYNSAASVRAADTALGLELDSGQTTYRANLAYRPTRDLMLFATYSTGFKSAGFEASNGATLGMNRVFDPETTTNYEIGAKSELFDRRLTLNATLFRTDVEDFQLRSFNGTVFTVRNAGSIRQQGIEFDVTARPVDGLTLSLAGIRLDSEYTDFRNAPGLPGFGGVQDLTGTRAPFSPKWQGVLSGRYEGDLPVGGLRFSIASNLSFQSDVSFGSDNSPQGVEPGYVLLGARVSVSDPDRGWEVFASGENITDTGYCTLRAAHTFNGPLGLNDPVNGGTVMRCWVGDPATFRFGAKVNF